MFNAHLIKNLKISALFMLSNIFNFNAYAVNCHALIDNRPQYIIGYGSLMSETSKRKTEPNAGDNIPVKVTGYERGWFLKGSHAGFMATYLGIKIKKNASMNAAVFNLTDPREIRGFDEREIGYCRFLVKHEAIHSLTKDKLPNGQYWIYIPKPDQVAEASEKYPIMQSYVDLLISGCLNLEKKYKLNGFAHECVTTTTHWSKHWVNDRIHPRRAWSYEPNALVIDKILQEEVPDFFNCTKPDSNQKLKC